MPWHQELANAFNDSEWTALLQAPTAKAAVQVLKAEQQRQDISSALVKLLLLTRGDSFSSSGAPGVSLVTSSM